MGMGRRTMSTGDKLEEAKVPAQKGWSCYEISGVAQDVNETKSFVT